MHEMSLTVSLLAIVREEMQKHGAEKLVLVRLRCGALANVAPEALTMAFEVLIDGTALEGARLELTEEPLRLACGACHQEFSPERGVAALFSPCPLCGEDIGHAVLAGKELYIDHIEVE
jgi:hydrogenase nickel incorporation protein HypA/HybF